MGRMLTFSFGFESKPNENLTADELAYIADEYRKFDRRFRDTFDSIFNHGGYGWGREVRRDQRATSIHYHIALDFDPLPEQVTELRKLMKKFYHGDSRANCLHLSNRGESKGLRNYILKKKKVGKKGTKFEGLSWNVENLPEVLDGYNCGAAYKVHHLDQSLGKIPSKKKLSGKAVSASLPVTPYSKALGVKRHNGVGVTVGQFSILVESLNIPSDYGASSRRPLTAPTPIQGDSSSDCPPSVNGESDEFKKLHKDEKLGQNRRVSGEYPVNPYLTKEANQSPSDQSGKTQSKQERLKELRELRDVCERDILRLYRDRYDNAKDFPRLLERYRDLKRRGATRPRMRVALLNLVKDASETRQKANPAIPLPVETFHRSSVA